MASINPALTLTFLALIAGTAGCVSVERGFEPVREEVAARAGKQVEWLGVTTPPEPIARRLHELLAGELTDAEAVQIALLNNFELQARFADVGIDRARLLDESLPANPELDILYLTAPGERGEWTFAAVTELVDLLLLPMTRRLAQAELRRTQLAVSGALIDLIGDVRRAYYRYVAAEQSFELWRTVLLAAEASYEMAERLRTAGNISELALVQERAILEEVKLEVSRAETDLAVTRERLNRLLGLWGEATHWQTPRRLAPVFAPTAPRMVEQLAIENSLDLAILQQGIEAAARRRGITRITSWLPRLNAGVELEQEREGGESTWWRGPSLSLPIPLFNWGQTQRALARLDEQRLRDLYLQRAVEVRSAARLAAHRLEAAGQRASYTRDVLVPVRHTATQHAQLHFNAMFIGIFRLLEARRDEIEAGRSYVDAHREYWLAQADFDQLMMGRMPRRLVDDGEREDDGRDTEAQLRRAFEEGVR